MCKSHCAHNASTGLCDFNLVESLTFLAKFEYITKWKYIDVAIQWRVKNSKFCITYSYLASYCIAQNFDEWLVIHESFSYKSSFLNASPLKPTSDFSKFCEGFIHQSFPH